VLHDPVAAREVVGRDAERELIAGRRRSIPDLAFTIDDLVADGDDVTIRWTAEGTHGGELLGSRAPGGRSRSGAWTCTTWRTAGSRSP
jgi:predicted ester cyclase